MNHALRLSKGVNRMINSTRQYLRLNFLRLRHVRTEADEAARIAAEEQARREADEDAAHAAAVGKTQDCRDAQIRSWCGRQRQGTAGHEPQRNRAHLPLHPRAHGRASVGRRQRNANLEVQIQTPSSNRSKLSWQTSHRIWPTSTRNCHRHVVRCWCW